MIKTAKELELEAVEAKTKRALMVEELRHKNAMEELEFMAEHNITSYSQFVRKNDKN